MQRQTVRPHHILTGELRRRDDLVGAGMSSPDFSSCSYMNADSLALEEDCDMPRFRKRLDERSISCRLREQHTNGDVYVRHWACDPGPAAAGR